MAVGALATHLADDAKAAELLRIGALYGMVHAAALIAVEQWKFRPARLGPDAIASKFTVRFLFDKAGVQWN